jgi:hypothetical protein
MPNCLIVNQIANRQLEIENVPNGSPIPALSKTQPGSEATRLLLATFQTLPPG